MSRSGRILVVTLSTVLAGITVLLITQALQRQRRDIQFAQQRARIERFLNIGDWNRAAAAIRGSEPPDQAGWRTLLRQARRVAEATGSDTLFAGTSERALAAHPQSEVIRAIHVIALIDADRLEEAGAAAEVLPVGEFEGVFAELTLKGADVRLPEGEGAASRIAAAIADPATHRLRAAWEASGEPSFALNAALSALGEGDRSSAKELVEHFPASPDFAEVGFLLAVEERDRERASSFLARLEAERQTAPEILLARADLARLDGRESDARLLYEDAILSDRSFSAVAWLGLSQLAETPADRIETLREALSAMPDGVRIALELSDALRENGDHDEAVAVLAETRERIEGSDPRLALSALESDVTISRERRFTARWELLEDFPESGALAAHLGAVALRGGDREGLSLVLARPASADTAWNVSARAALEFASGRREQALDLFGATGDRAGREWYNHYNRALLLLEAERFGDAAIAWEAALEHAYASNTGARERLEIYLRAAETALRRGRQTDALRYVQSAANAHPGSARARLLLRTIGAP